MTLTCWTDAVAKTQHVLLSACATAQHRAHWTKTLHFIKVGWIIIHDDVPNVTTVNKEKLFAFLVTWNYRFLHYSYLLIAFIIRHNLINATLCSSSVDSTSTLTNVQLIWGTINKLQTNNLKNMQEKWHLYFCEFFWRAKQRELLFRFALLNMTSGSSNILGRAAEVWGLFQWADEKHLR